MQNPFTPEELHLMLQATYIAVCVAELNPETRERDAESMQKLADLEQKLFSMAGDFDAEQLTALDVPSGNWMPTRELEEQSFAARCLKAQEDYIYWDRLVADLTDRDLHETGGFSRWDEMSLNERDALLSRAEEKYWQSFEKEGIRHLRLATQQTGGNN
ncbi:MAG: hypothetical protein ACI8XO_004352 [Verrucomicrobiales bacterium]